MKSPLLLCLALASLVLASCSTPEASSTASAKTEPAKSATVLHVALSPSEDAEKMVAGFEPIRAQLAKDLGMEVKVEKVTDYASVIEAQKAGKVDLAWYGPLSYVLASQEAGVQPILLGQEEGKSTTYHSIFVVPAASPARSVADLKGKKVAFVDPGSTSGNLVPRMAIMKAANAKAEDFFGNFSYAGSHDAALLSLVNGNVDACAIQDITFRAKTDSKEVDASKFRVLWTSDPIPQSPLAVRKDLDPELVKKITESFLAMDTRGIKMDVAGVGKFQKFVKIGPEAYQPVADMAKTLGLTKADMAK